MMLILVINLAPVDTTKISLEKPYVHVFLISIILSKPIRVLLSSPQQPTKEALPPPPTPLEKLICSVLLAPVRELLLPVRVLSVFW
ncbi:hypothetical protein SLEP1_g42464 [Rubroshorea leprosula]|uniref:Uncharacterized protein n=1 Tax=Rubroshorea leprosula TaxID=152421 RepID=A0AAV5L9W2_9ROSI|nr:hypothetical protein SLEP1_g42464 [Rubroshorea leprosula]